MQGGRLAIRIDLESFRFANLGMNDPKKGIARIPVPSKDLEGRSNNPERRVTEEPALNRVEASSRPVVDTSLQEPPNQTKGILRPVRKPDPALVPLIGLLLAFCLISLIVQLLIAFG